jgi:two-component system LytT family response regulator
MKKYSALLLDDNQDNNDLLKRYLNKCCPEIEPIFMACNLIDAFEIVQNHTINIFILDIDLGDGSTSFNFLENSKINEPEIIFISSFKDFAIETINYNAKAFLVKPLKIENLLPAVNKIINNIENRLKLVDLATLKNNKFIAISSLDKIDIILCDDIISCSADGKYTVFQTVQNKTYVSSRNLGEYERLFDPNQFYRIHHKHIVNLKHIVCINKTTGFYCDLSNGKNLPISKRKRDEIKKYLRLSI